MVKRIAMMDRTSPDVIKEVERILESKLSNLVNQDYSIVGGVDAVVDILNTVDRGTEKHIMETLEIEEPEMADEIRKKMFVSKIFSSWTTVLFSVSFEMWIMEIWLWH